MLCPCCGALQRAHQFCHALFTSWHTLDSMKFQCIEHVGFQLLVQGSPLLLWASSESVFLCHAGSQEEMALG